MASTSAGDLLQRPQHLGYTQSVGYFRSLPLPHPPNPLPAPPWILKVWKGRQTALEEAASGKKPTEDNHDGAISGAAATAAAAARAHAGKDTDNKDEAEKEKVKVG